MRRQCELLGLNRASLYYEPLGESEENLRLLRLLDEQYTRAPFYGSRKMTEWLRTKGFEVNRKRVSRLMTLLAVEAVYPKPKLSQPGAGHKIYPYLLREVEVSRVNQVWSTATSAFTTMSVCTRVWITGHRRRSTRAGHKSDDPAGKKEEGSTEHGDSVPNPWDLTLLRQNVCLILKALERGIGLRRDATRAPIQGPEWQGAASMPTPSHTRIQTRRTLAN